MENKGVIPAIIKDLAEGVSRQTVVLNRYWLALAVVIIIALIPKPQGNDPANITALPWGLGPVDSNYFHVVLLLLISVLSIAFSSAHAQVIRAQFLFDRAIKINDLSASNCSGIDPRDLYDVLRNPNVTRVAPLAQIARGKRQFFTDSTSDLHWSIMYGTGVYYTILKLLSLLVYLGLPFFTLIYEYINVFSVRTGINNVLFNFINVLVIASGFTLLHVLHNELWYFGRVFRILFTKSKA